MPRYLSLIRIDEQDSARAFASPESQQAIGALFKEITEAGVMLETAGLTESAAGATVTWAAGKLSVTDGPFAEAKEVVGGYALMQCRDRAEALEWTRRFLSCHDASVTVTAELREVKEG
ncbi:YciI family protein [Streptacidiphilus jiangxiensis]|uniref:Uncharacterized conserved protein n=1 Tax=Streptacidiphilus jiangxiensis TaxID=235985 RepID=A0A1H7VGI8_STRJI|nr:YciI family protein [Streptacidiphilus jiangxiensis]SEM07995.1 Uncharacterized conserved protein [Streptacidiphilus jiangxiensis]